MDYTERPTRRVSSYQGVVVELTEDIVALPNGASTVREVVHHPGGVCVAAVDEAGNVALVRQYRYPFSRHLLELPAGKLEKGEDPFDAVKRGLSEETGLEAEHWTDLGAIYVSPGISTETLYLYLATGLRQGKAHPDPNEFLDVEKMPLSQLAEMAMNGAVRDAKTVIGALKAAAILGKN